MHRIPSGDLIVLSAFKKLPRKYLIIIAVVAVGAIIGVFAVIQFLNSSSDHVPPAGATDTAFFITPNTQRIENVRAWLMLPYNPNSPPSFGYDNTTGMIA